MNETMKSPVYIEFPEKTPEQIRKEIEYAWPGTRELDALEWECRLEPDHGRGRVLEDHELTIQRSPRRKTSEPRTANC